MLCELFYTNSRCICSPFRKKMVMIVLIWPPDSIFYFADGNEIKTDYLIWFWWRAKLVFKLKFTSSRSEFAIWSAWKNRSLQFISFANTSVTTFYISYICCMIETCLNIVELPYVASPFLSYLFNVFNWSMIHRDT